MRIITTTDLVQRDGTIIKAGSIGKVFACSRDSGSFYTTMDDGTFIFIKAWEFDRIEENA